MKAVVITQFGKPEVLQIQDRPVPAIGAKEVLLKVRAAGINKPDIFQRKGHYPAPAGTVQDVPGLEVAGEIEAIGAEVDTVKVGDRVCCLLAGGGYATHVAVDAQLCLPIPEGITFAQAAALPETVFTVWDNVFRRGRLQPGERILIQGGSGGIGSTAIQLCKAMGAEVYTTTSSKEKMMYCKQLGADHILNYKEADFEEQWKEQQINVVLDSIGGDYFPKHINLLTAEGRLVQINAVSGADVQLPIFKLMQKRLILTGSTLRSREQDFKIALTKEVERSVWPMLGHTFIPQVFETFPMEEAAAAHRRLESGVVCGKLVLTTDVF